MASNPHDSSSRFSDYTLPSSLFPSSSSSSETSSSPIPPHDPFLAAFPMPMASPNARGNADGRERRTSMSPGRKAEEDARGQEPFDTLKVLLEGSHGGKPSSLHPSSASLTPTRPGLSRPTRLVSTSSVPIITSTPQPILLSRPSSASGQYEHDHSSLPPHPHPPPAPNKPVTPLSKKNIFLSTSPFHPSIHNHPSDPSSSRSPSRRNHPSFHGNQTQPFPSNQSASATNPSLKPRHGHTRSPSLPSQLPSSQQDGGFDYFHPRAQSSSSQSPALQHKPRVELTMEEDPFGAFPAQKPSPPQIVVRDLSDRGESSESESESDDDNQSYPHQQQHHHLSQAFQPPRRPSLSNPPPAPLPALPPHAPMQELRQPFPPGHINRQPIPSPLLQPSLTHDHSTGHQAETSSSRQTSSTSSSPQIPNHRLSTSPPSDASTVIPSSHPAQSNPNPNPTDPGEEAEEVEEKSFSTDDDEPEANQTLNEERVEEQGTYLTRPLGLLALSQALAAANEEVEYLRSTVREITGMVVAPFTPLFQRLTLELPKTSTDEGSASGDGQKAEGGSGLDVGGGRRVGLDEIDDLSGSEAREMLKSLATSRTFRSSPSPPPPPSLPALPPTAISLIHHLHGLISPSALHVSPSQLHTLFTDDRLQSLGSELERWGRIVRRVEDEERRARGRGGTL